MSKPRERWWPYVRAVIRDYPRTDRKKLSARERRAVDRALEAMDEEKRKFVRAYYWHGNRIDAAGYMVHIGEATACRWNGEIVRAVARELGLTR